MSERRCGECRWYDPDKDESCGDCWGPAPLSMWDPWNRRKMDAASDATDCPCYQPKGNTMGSDRANRNNCILGGGTIPLGTAGAELVKALARDEALSGPETERLIKAVQDAAFQALYDYHEASRLKLLDDLKTRSVKDLMEVKDGGI